MDILLTTDNAIIFIQTLGIVIGAVVGSIFYTVLGKGENRFQFFRRRSFRALVRLRSLHKEIHAKFTYKQARTDLIQAIETLEKLNNYNQSDFLSKKHLSSVAKEKLGKTLSGDKLITWISKELDVHGNTFNKINGRIDVKKDLFKELKNQGFIQELKGINPDDYPDKLLVPSDKSRRDANNFYDLSHINEEINKELTAIYCTHYLSPKTLTQSNTHASIFKLDGYNELVIQQNDLNYMDLDVAHGTSISKLLQQIDNLSEVKND